MPPLTERQVDEIRAWLTERVTENCPACGLPDWWTVQPRVLTVLDIDTINTSRLDGPTLVAVTCRGCGVYLLFNGAVIKP